MTNFRGWGFGLGITPAVKNLILINVGAFILELLLRLKWAPLLGLTPVNFWRGYLWQPFTYMFLHGGIFHLLINMFILWMFGTTLESTWGTRRFLRFYFICGVGAGILNAAVTPGSPIPTVGASGAIYGLLMAFGILFPNQIILVWGIFPVKAKFFVIGIGAVEFLSAISTTHSSIAHFAHLGGMLFGLIYLKWNDLLKHLSKWQTEQKRRQHLKVVWNREREKEKLRKEVDELLIKINNSGIDSLSPQETERLREAGLKLKEWEDND